MLNRWWNGAKAEWNLRTVAIAYSHGLGEVEPQWMFDLSEAA